MYIKIAVCLTCFNRKEKTLSCISDIYKQQGLEQIDLDIFVVDGGSSDGTPESIKERYPNIHIYVQKGLYWAGGMRYAWSQAVKKKQYDFFWLINDDTHLYPDCLKMLLETNSFSINSFQKQGIYIGSTIDPKSKKFTYGGRKLIKWGNNKAYEVHPNGFIQSCDLGNANIMLISNSVYNTIGHLSKKYTHGIADFDYTLRARIANIPVLVAPQYSGECTNDHYEYLYSCYNFNKRIQYLYSPKGLAYHEYLYYIKSFFPKQYYISVLKLWGKILFPSLWRKFK